MTTLIPDRPAAGVPLTQSEALLLVKGDVLKRKIDGLLVAYDGHITPLSIGAVCLRTKKFWSGHATAFSFVERPYEDTGLFNVQGAVLFLQQAEQMLGRGEMPAAGTAYAEKWRDAHRVVIKALSTGDAVTRLKAMAAEVQPVICLGDEDSIFLTEQQVGYRAGLLVAAELIEKGSEK